MFRRAQRLIRSFRPLLTASTFALTYTASKIKLDSNPPQIEKVQVEEDPHRLLKKIIQKDICESTRIREGELFITEITQQLDDGSTPRTFKVAISRVNGKLYAVIGHCPHQQPLEQNTSNSNSFEEAIIFKDKLYCPHHGCAFDIKSGTVEYGPSLENLSRIYVEEKDGKVKLFHPAKIPTSVQPKYQFRDLNDLRKVVIMGGDNNATMGVIQGLKQFDYGGQITVIQTGDGFDFPYRDDLLHKHVLNLNKGKIFTSYKDTEIEKNLEEKIYSKLKFYDNEWYQAFGVDFIFNNSPYRVINKKYFPFVKFADDTKVEFDGIVFATGFVPMFPAIKNITFTNKQDELIVKNLPGNVFAPFYNKSQHLRLVKFLNQNSINNLIVLGMNVESLEFIQGFKKEFPDKKVHVVDINKENSLTELYGPDISKQIINEYIKRGVDFYVKLQDIPECTNTYNTPRQISPLFSNIAFPTTPVNSPVNSINIKLDPTFTLYGDCMVLFPNNVLGNTQLIRNSKYVDLDFSKMNNRLVVDPHSRTDTKRMFGVGSCSSLEFFFTRNRIDIINPLVAYEQGYTAAFNLNALNVPFHYIPFEKHTFFDKTLLYAGARKTFNSMYVMGDPKKWDFIAFYALQDQILAVSATPSKQKQFQVIRESFRLQCAPGFESLVKGQWNVPKIYKLIRKLDKSGCYRDLMKTLDPADNIGQVIWMQRDKGSTSHTDETEDESNVEVDRKGYVKEL